MSAPLEQAAADYVAAHRQPGDVPAERLQLERAAIAYTREQIGRVLGTRGHHLQATLDEIARGLEFAMRVTPVPASAASLWPRCAEVAELRKTIKTYDAELRTITEARERAFRSLLEMLRGK